MDIQTQGKADVLRRRLLDAQISYKQAVAAYQRLMAVCAVTSHPNDPGSVDGMHALRQAVTVHQIARRKYESALKEFTDFVLHRSAPDK